MHVLAWLEEQGKLSPAQYEGVLHHAARTGERVEDALIETGTFEEAELLKLLAARYKTRFVSTERLCKADIDRKTLERIPHKIAERLQVFPVVYDARAASLSFVAAAPGEDDVEKQVLVVSGLREARALVARPAAIRAAIEKFYRKNPRAFADLSARETPPPSQLDVYDPSPFDDGFEDPFTGLMSGPAASIEVVREPEPPRAPAPPLAPPALAPRGTIPADLPSTDAPHIDPEAYLETLNVFVSLLERERGELRGHSSQVARLSRLVAERVGLPPGDRHAISIAAYLHDVGKGAQGYHLTALNVARYEGHRLQAQKSREVPAKLFAAARVGDGVARILAHLYERFDGQGFPDRLAGKDIPYGARVLALVETYCDLVGNSRNPYRKVLSAPQALSVVRELSGTLFDPTLADLLRHVVLGEDTSQATGRTRALIVDPDPEETTVLEMRLLEHGFAVSVARDLAAARDQISNDPPDVVVTEVDLGGGGQSGFELPRFIAELPEEQRPALVFLTTHSDRESVSRAFDLGAADYIVKPASAELVATKLGQVAQSSARRQASGVSGSLREMSLPDVVQILCNGRRGGRLQIVSGGKRGEVHFADGQIHDAQFGGIGGEEAFYAMLKLTDGTFSLDPSFAPSRRVIHASAEGLLLEGMRRLDEGLV